MQDGDGATERLNEFVHRTSAADVPGVARRHAERMILDTLGVALAGHDADPAQIVREAKVPDGDQGGVRILGTAREASPGTAALLHGVMAHALDFDDVHHGMGGHPSSPVLAALLSVADRGGATAAGAEGGVTGAGTEGGGVTGEAFLRAFVLGTEVSVTMANVLNPGHYERGWHPTAVLGALGATAAVGALCGHNETELRNAIGIAASQAGGIKANFGTMTKPYHVGFAARGAVEAARLAVGGFTAGADAIEAEFGGFCDLFQGEPPYDFGDHLDALGDPWKLLAPPVGFKPYPCCGSTHAAVDAASAIRAAGDVESLADVEAVTIRSHPRRLDHTDDPAPTTPSEAKFSVQYCATAALGEGTVGLDHFEPTAVEDAARRSFLDRVTVERNRDQFAERTWGGEVTVELRDGSVRTETVDAPTGSAENPMSDAELEAKYLDCASRAVTRDRAERSLELLDRLEALNDVRTLVDVLTDEPRSRP